MAIIKRLFIFAFFCFTIGFIYPQDQNVYIQQTDEGARIIQRLTWPGDRNASQYRLTVERQEGKGYVEVHGELTLKTVADLSLGPGNYRYQVAYYNLLKQVEYVSNWANFNIILAVQPVVSRYEDGFYLYEDPDFDLDLWGENFVEGAEVYLTAEDGSKILPQSYTVNNSGKHAVAVFAEADLIPGSYQLLIRNPGGLEAVEPVRVSYYSPFDLTVAAGYAPMLPIYGFLFDYYSDVIYPLGAQARAGYFFIKRPWGFLGVEAALGWNYLKTEGDSVEISLHAMDLAANMVYKKLLPNRSMAVLARAGLGVAVTRFTFDFGRSKTNTTTWMPLIDAGLAFQWYVRKPIHLNLGIDYIHLLSVDKPQPGFLRPYVEIGWHFGAKK
jgi:hypothetical protein